LIIFILFNKVYEDFSTAHSLFGIPIVEDDFDGGGYNHDAILFSNIKEEKNLLFENTSLVVGTSFCQITSSAYSAPVPLHKTLRTWSFCAWAITGRLPPWLFVAIWQVSFKQV
jgi:hypothetical protein